MLYSPSRLNTGACPSKTPTSTSSAHLNLKALSELDRSRGVATFEETKGEEVRRTDETKANSRRRHIFRNLSVMNNAEKETQTMLFLPREEGQGLVEYALILVLVAIVVIVILAILGPAIGNVFSNIVNAI